jgi:methanogenic corrinoid protein MtbC1
MASIFEIQIYVEQELIAAAASYEAMKVYEKHVEKNGKPDSHHKAKEIMAGAIGAFIDREVETKGVCPFIC